MEGDAPRSRNGGRGLPPSSAKRNPGDGGRRAAEPSGGRGLPPSSAERVVPHVHRAAPFSFVYFVLASTILKPIASWAVWGRARLR